MREGAGAKQTLPSDRRFPVPIQNDAITYVLKDGETLKVVAINRKGLNTQIALMIIGAPQTQ